MFKKIFYIFYIFIIFLFLPLHSRGEEIPRIDNKNYNIQLINQEKISEPVEHYRYSFEINYKNTREKSVIKIENLIEKITSISNYKNLLIIFGYVGDNISSGISIVDLTKKEEPDFLICYHPVVSATGRYLIYEKFYPRFAPEQVQSSLILIYDLELSPQENRMGDNYKKIISQKKDVGTPEYQNAAENAGFPVYPETNSLNQSYSVWAESVNDRHRLLSLNINQFLWFNDDKKVVFIDYCNKENWLTLIDLSQGLNSLKINRKIIDLSGILTISSKQSDYAKLLQYEKDHFRASGLKYDNTNNNIQILITPYNLYKSNIIELKVP